MKLIWRSLGITVLTALVVVCVLLYFFQRFHTTADKVVFHSKFQDQACFVPFQLRNNLISFQADFAGRKEDCILDTGSPAILWPRSANLPGKRTLSWGFAKDAAGRQATVTEFILSSIKIGSYELQGVPTLAISGNSSSSRSYPDLHYICDLGNAAFSQTAMTIDYKKHVLLLRNQQYDPILHCSKTCFVLPFQWKSKTPGTSKFGYLVVAAEISGQPLNLVVDTGDSSPATALTDSYYKAHLRQTLMRHNWVQKTAFGETKADWLPELKVSVPDARPNAPEFVINQPAVILPDQQDGVDAVIGYAVLKDYLVTIDYPRHRIFLERN